MNEINSKHYELDETDRTLLEALQHDGRCGYTKLGAMVGLTAGGARRRVMRLEERGVVQIVGVTNPLRLGYDSMAMVGVVSSTNVEQIADILSELHNVVYVVITAGQFDLLVEVIAENQQDLFKVINQQIREVPGVLQAETFTYYSIRTHRFGWKIPPLKSN